MCVQFTLSIFYVMLHVKVFKIFFGLKSKGHPIEALHKALHETLLRHWSCTTETIHWRRNFRQLQWRSNAVGQLCVCVCVCVSACRCVSIEMTFRVDIWLADSFCCYLHCRIVCGAGYTKRSNVRPSVRLSVPSIDSSSGVRRVCSSAPCGQEI